MNKHISKTSLFEARIKADSQMLGTSLYCFHSLSTIARVSCFLILNSEANSVLALRSVFVGSLDGDNSDLAANNDSVC